MRISKAPKIILSIYHHLIYYPTPVNITYNWSFGGLLLIFMTFQILTGILLAMHYTANIDLAFFSVEKHIMQDVNNGWLIRYLHSNGASIIFALLYLHIGRTLYYKTYNSPRQWLWVSGVLLFFLLMAAAFLGYVLPWGQMSFWGATVITNLFTTIPLIGNKIAVWIWGGFSVSNATLVRFFALHYLIPFLVYALIIIHIALLHESGSTNLIEENSIETKDFAPYFIIKDLFVLISFLFFYFILIIYYPNLLGHPDNAIPANPLVTPKHIVPEWYFLPFYAILKSVPSKGLGVLLMGFSILILVFFCDANDKNSFNLSTKRTLISNWYKTIFWFIVVNLFLLGWIGSMPAQAPYVNVGKVLTFLYGFLFLLYLSPAPSFDSFKNFYFKAYNVFSEFTTLFNKKKNDSKFLKRDSKFIFFVIFVAVLSEKAKEYFDSQYISIIESSTYKEVENQIIRYQHHPIFYDPVVILHWGINCLVFSLFLELHGYRADPELLRMLYFT